MYQFVKGAPSPSGNVEEDEEYASATVGDYVGATLFAFFSAAVCFYWMGFTLNNTWYVNEYTSLNQFHSARYNWVDWYPVWLLTFNCSLPMLFAFAITYSGVRVWGRIHELFTSLCILANIYSLVILTLEWVWYCNNAGSGIHSACNDYRWCGAYFDNMEGFCTNGLPFSFPYDVTSSMLSRNREMTENWIYCFVFLVFCVLHLWINKEYRSNSILK